MSIRKPYWQNPSVTRIMADVERYMTAVPGTRAACFTAEIPESPSHQQRRWKQYTMSFHNSMGRRPIRVDPAEPWERNHVLGGLQALVLTTEYLSSRNSSPELSSLAYLSAGRALARKRQYFPFIFASCPR